MSGRSYDVAVVGASIAGCTAARLYAQCGARVALIERRPSLDAYKTVCTHFIQSSANPTIDRLGLAPLLDARSALLNTIEVWTPFGGWIRLPPGTERGYSITRKTLDPVLRRLAAETPGVDLLSGETVVDLLDGGRPAGVEIEDRSRPRRNRCARLVVAADGRDTRVARMARFRAREGQHGRFFYWAYYRDLELPSGEDSPDVDHGPGRCLRVPDGGRRQARAWRRRTSGGYPSQGRPRGCLRALPDRPARRSGARGRDPRLEADRQARPAEFRPAAHPGIAFVGDAALACDPFWGVGCGWAFQSADWLVEETAAALAGGGDLDAGLERYRRRTGATS